MRVFVCIITVLSALLASCGDSEDAVFADLTWSVRCAQGLQCSVGETCLGRGGNRRIEQFDDEQVCPEVDSGLQALRAVCELGSGEDRVSMRLIATVSNSDEEQYGIEVTGLVADPQTGDILEPGQCKVSVFEDGALYEGRTCGDADPSAEQPCQISGLAIDQDSNEVRFRLRCEGLRSQGGGIDVAGTSSGSTASVSFSNCN